MEIIKRGQHPDEKPWFARCVVCNSELKATRKELKIEYDQRESSEFGRADCPVCGKDAVFYPKGN